MKNVKGSVNKERFTNYGSLPTLHIACLLRSEIILVDSIVVIRRQ